MCESRRWAQVFPDRDTQELDIGLGGASRVSWGMMRGPNESEQHLSLILLVSQAVQ